MVFNSRYCSVIVKMGQRCDWGRDAKWHRKWENALMQSKRWLCKSENNMACSYQNSLHLLKGRAPVVDNIFRKRILIHFSTAGEGTDYSPCSPSHLTVLDTKCLAYSPGASKWCKTTSTNSWALLWDWVYISQVSRRITQQAQPSNTRSILVVCYNILCTLYTFNPNFEKH